MEHELNYIYHFLAENREYNAAVRRLEYQKAFAGIDNPAHKVVGLLYSVYSTQAFPRLDYQMEFLEAFDVSQEYSTMDAFLCKLIETKPHLKRTEVCNTSGEPVRIDYQILYKCLQAQKGWGQKTAALFSKMVFDIHANHLTFAFWPDAPRHIAETDELYLPVDAVIIFLFNRLDPSNKWDFDSINQLLKTYWDGEDIFLWDDLWFWGFITQKGSGKKRSLELNPPKLWSLQTIPKQADILERINAHANQFVNQITEASTVI